MTTLSRLRPYQKLVVWNEAHHLCLSVYSSTSLFPKDERFGLISQMRRAAYSIPMNIAEGSNKRSPAEKDRFYEYSSCSLEELHYQCLLARDLNYLNDPEFSRLAADIGKVGYLLMKIRDSVR